MLEQKSNKFFTGLIIIVIVIVFLDLAVYAVYKGLNQATPSLKVNSAQASTMSIKTNKLSYASNEVVVVTIINSGIKPIVETRHASSDDEITVKGAPNLGKNYGVALIEKYNEDGWLAIEPLWRCDSSCTEPCAEPQVIKPGETKVFSWSQERRFCRQGDENMKHEVAGPGRYRIASAVMNGQGYKIIRSEEFVIN